MGEEIHSVKVGLDASLSESHTDPIAGNNPSAAVLPRTQADSVWHYVLSAPTELSLNGPVAFNNFARDDLAQAIAVRADLEIDLHLPWTQGPGPVHWGVEGIAALKPPIALRGVDSLALLDDLVALLERVLKRQIPFAEAKRNLDLLQLPAFYRNRVLESSFRTSEGSTQSGVGGVQELIAAVGGQATGFELNESGVAGLLKELRQAAGKALDALLSDPRIEQTLAFLVGLNRLAKKANGRKKQIIHLVPNTWRAGELGEYLKPYANGEAGDARVAALCFPYVRVGLASDPQADVAEWDKLAWLGASLQAAMCIQFEMDSESESQAWINFLRTHPEAARIFLFAGRVARRVAGPVAERCLFQPALVTFLEGMLAENASPGDFRDKYLLVEDQDVHDGPAKAFSTQELRTETQIRDASASGCNWANGAVGADTVRFPPLTPLAPSR